MSENEAFEHEDDEYSNDITPAAISLPGIEIALEESAPQPVTASKLGGVPYLAPDAEQPRSEDGDPLMFLLQIRCEDLPANEFLPESGLLQFWHGTDDLMGADLSDPLESACAVVHVKSPDESVTAEDVLDRYEVDEDEVYSPLPAGTQVQDGQVPEREFALHFSFAEEAGPEEAGGHRLGGHAEFVQEDPRPREDELRPYTVQLLQLDSDETGLGWGDMGVGHFFVTEEQAKARDYSQVLYTWDCG